MRIALGKNLPQGLLKMSCQISHTLSAAVSALATLDPSDATHCHSRIWHVVPIASDIALMIESFSWIAFSAFGSFNKSNAKILFSY